MEVESSVGFICADGKLFSYCRVSTRRKRNSLVSQKTIDKPWKLPVSNATQVTVTKKKTIRKVFNFGWRCIKEFYVFKSSVPYRSYLIPVGHKHNKNYLTFLRIQFVYISVWLWSWHVRQPYVSSTFEGRQDQDQDVVWYTLRPFRVENLQELFSGFFATIWLLSAVSTGTPIAIKVARIIQKYHFL